MDAHAKEEKAAETNEDARLEDGTRLKTGAARVRGSPSTDRQASAAALLSSVTQADLVIWLHGCKE